MTKVLFGVVVMMGCGMAAAGVVFATPEPPPAAPADPCPASTDK
ncbi:hypothetical protein AB0J42_34985 [Nonomuraea sp. NPDC049649]